MAESHSEIESAHRPRSASSAATATKKEPASEQPRSTVGAHGPVEAGLRPGAPGVPAERLRTSVLEDSIRQNPSSTDVHIGDAVSGPSRGRAHKLEPHRWLSALAITCDTGVLTAAHSAARPHGHPPDGPVAFRVVAEYSPSVRSSQCVPRQTRCHRRLQAKQSIKRRNYSPKPSS